MDEGHVAIGSDTSSDSHYHKGATHPCPKGDNCALNSGAVHCFACRRNWPRDETWEVPFAQRPVRNHA